jgi:predicted ABC-type sugar transport system permease subunit
LLKSKYHVVPRAVPNKNKFKVKRTFLAISSKIVRVYWTCSKTEVIELIANGLNLLNVPQGVQRMVKGVIIVAAVIFDVLRRKRIKK